MSALIHKKCVPCEGATLHLTPKEIKSLVSQVDKSWEVLDNLKLKRKFKFKDFLEAMHFVNKVADVAEREQHHPNIEISYNIVNIVLWTHAIAGLSENDFIMAAKIDQI